MYKIYAEEMAVTASKLCIYHDAENLESICLPDPKLTMEDNSAGQLTLTMPPANAGYDSVNRLTTTLTVYKDDVEIWSGRVISEDMDFWNQRSLTCEGELAFLNDSIQPPEEYHIESSVCVEQFLKDLIKIHNAQVEDYKQFDVGTVTVHDSNGYLYKYTNYNTTWDCIQEKLLDTYGGHLVITKGSNGRRTLNYYDNYPGTSTQRIEFGKNLLDFTKSWDMTDFATVILPRGAQLEQEVEYDGEGNVVNSTEYIEALVPYTNLEDYSATSGSIVTRIYSGDDAYLGQYVINTEAVANYGWISVVVDWSDVTEKGNLWNKAVAYLEDIQFDDLQLEINAVDLHYLGADYDTINLLDQVVVLSRPHGLVGSEGTGKEFPVTKLDIPLNDPENATFTFGDKVNNTLTGSTRSANSDILNRIESMKLPDVSSEAAKLLEEAISVAQENANNMIARATEGYITIVYDQDLRFPESRSQAIYISNDVDYTSASDFWVWNRGGLAHYHQGTANRIKDANGNWIDLPNVAINMDGSIYASYITAGVITADLITAGTLVDVSGGGYFYLDISNGQLFIGQGNNLSNSISAHTSENTRNPVAMIGPWTITMSSMYYGGSTISSTTSPTVYFGEEGMNLYYSSSAYVRINNGKLTAMGSDITTISDYADSTGRYQYTQMVGGYLKFYYGTSQSDSNNIGGIRSTYWEPNGTSYRGLDISLESNGYVLCLGGVQNSNGTYITPMVINPKGYSLNDSSGNSGYSQNVIVFGTFYANSVTMSGNVQVTLSDNNGWSQSSYSGTIPTTLSINIGGAKVSYAGNADTATKLATSRKITISSSSGNTYANFDGSGDITLYIGSLLPSSSTYTHPDPFEIGTLTVTTKFTANYAYVDHSLWIGGYDNSSSNPYSDYDLTVYAYINAYGATHLYGNNYFGGGNANNTENYAQYFYGGTYFYRTVYLGYNGSTTAGNNYTNHETNIMGWTYLYGTLNLTSWAASNTYHIHIYPISENWHMCIGGLNNSESSGYDECIFFGHSLSSSIPGAVSNKTYPFLRLKFLASYYDGEWDSSNTNINDYFQLIIDCHRIDIGENSPTEFINIGNSSATVRQFGSWSTSDISLKTCIHPLEKDSTTYLNIIDNITPVSYIYIDDKYSRQRYGYIANDVYNACGGAYGLVWRDTDDGLLYLNYTDLIPLLHLKIKQLEKRIEELESPTIIEEED